MFDWDDGNLDHIAEHGVQDWEVEEAYEDRGRWPIPAYGGRSAFVGRTEDGRLLVVIYESRGGQLRVVTARDASAREQRNYRRANR
jgi:uncharacterized DUF497 family protein